MFRHSALDDADQWRAVAMDRRNRGLPCGKGGLMSDRERDRRRGGVPEVGSVDRFIAELRCAWDCARADALEDFRRVAFPERYEDFDGVTL